MLWNVQWRVALVMSWVVPGGRFMVVVISSQREDMPVGEGSLTMSGLCTERSWMFRPGGGASMPRWWRQMCRAIVVAML